MNPDSVVQIARRPPTSTSQSNPGSPIASDGPVPMLDLCLRPKSMDFIGVYSCSFAVPEIEGIQPQMDANEREFGEEGAMDWGVRKFWTNKAGE